MFSSHNRITMLTLAAAPLLLNAGAEAPRSKANTPSSRILLQDIGAPALPGRFLAAGASVFTVNILDHQHLLVTFGARSLVRRREEAKADDDDRNITAEVIEVPSGKVLAKTEWQLHDHARYLWPIAPGRFLLRMGNELSMLAPLENLHQADAFLRIAVPHPDGIPVGVTSTPDGSLISVITQLPPRQHEGPVVLLGDEGDNKPKPEYALDFFRLEGSGTPENPVLLRRAGAVKSPLPLAIPMSTDGYLWAEETRASHWDVSFNGFTGKVLNVGAVDSSCPPRLKLLSDVQYIALTCNGAVSSPKLIALGLDGHETWEEPFGEFSQAPAFVNAPSAGRFAMIRTNTVEPTQGNGMATESTTQEVRVYQTESGDLLLKVTARPAFRTPENFDLSADGLMLVAVVGDEIDVYALPAPSKRDQEELAEVKQFHPPSANGAPVLLTRLIQAPASVAASVAAPTSTTTQAALPIPRMTEKGDLGDVLSTGVRQAPTLLNPGEVPEFKDKTRQPQ